MSRRREIPRPPIRHVWEHYDGIVTGRGSTGWVKASCVLHEDKDPSASINEDEDLWKCFVCDAHGDAIDLIMRMENVDFLASLRVAEELLAESGGAVSRSDRPETSLLPSRQGHRQGRRNWTPPWLGS